MLFLVLDPLVLISIMYLVARHDADLQFIKLFLICLVLSFLVQGSSLFVGAFALVIYVALLPVALVQFCCLRWKIAALVVGIFLVVKVILMVLILILCSR